MTVTSSEGSDVTIIDKSRLPYYERWNEKTRTLAVCWPVPPDPDPSGFRIALAVVLAGFFGFLAGALVVSYEIGAWR